MQRINCAIYVRKSTEKGLEQEFNSLHNQEEACKNYILSQAFNSWEYYKTYEDGGISGGTMKRPSLKRMLHDMKKGLVQTVVVYKVDRLSRSIIDFHNMMKEFEKHNCSFVSITQAFDTSNSMGKLTLNMLLSFAQFEREVSSERVRDKIAASKKKGLWTGGCPPLGYDLSDKKLIPNPKEAEHVRFIFEKYLEVKSLSKLREFLSNTDVRTKKWVSETGFEKGGKVFFSSMLSRLLRSKVYIGKIESKKDGVSYPGKHQSIIDRKLFDRVQSLIDDNRNQFNKAYNKNAYLLSNKISDDRGNVFKNQQCSKKNSRKSLKVGSIKYRYYALKGKYLPSGDVDEITTKIVRDLLDHPLHNLLSRSQVIEFKAIDFQSLTPNERSNLIRSMINRIIYHNNKLTYFIKIDDLTYLKSSQKKNYLNTTNATTTYNDNIASTSINEVLPINLSLRSMQHLRDNPMAKISPLTETAINNEEHHSITIDADYHNEIVCYPGKHNEAGTRLSKDNDAIIFPSKDAQELIVEKEICINNRPSTNKYLGSGKKMISIGENCDNLIKALSTGWRYEKMSQNGQSIKKIAEAERMAKRTVYKYLNLNYLSPNIINSVMDSEVPTHINLQALFKIASKYPNFNDQERVFYDI
ncbi:MAG: recombinase family protein [Candidatus Eremiobacteraeota bacterium]|nr:recombinase family protein [Candidatus Eremiobacteraeota bacterium]